MMSRGDLAFHALCSVLLSVLVGLWSYGLCCAISRGPKDAYGEAVTLPDGRKVTYFCVQTPHETKYIYMIDGVPVEAK